MDNFNQDHYRFRRSLNENNPNWLERDPATSRLADKVVFWAIMLIALAFICMILN